jgi:carbamoyltransferase
LRILGISAFYHDSAAALIEDGRIVAAAQEERFSRKKHDSRFPLHALRYCLAEGGVGLGGVDHVVFYDKPFLKFERLLETYVAFAPRGIKSFSMAIPLWLREMLFLKDLLNKELARSMATELERTVAVQRASSQPRRALSSVTVQEAVVLTMDGVWLGDDVRRDRQGEPA